MRHQKSDALLAGLHSVVCAGYHPGQRSESCMQSHMDKMPTQQAHRNQGCIAEQQPTARGDKGSALTRTLVYKLASVVPCTAHADCSGGPSLRRHCTVKADGCATQEPHPLAQCMQMPNACKSCDMQSEVHLSSMEGHNTRRFHAPVSVSHTSRIAMVAPCPAAATMILSRN